MRVGYPPERQPNRRNSWRHATGFTAARRWHIEAVPRAHHAFLAVAERGMAATAVMSTAFLARPGLPPPPRVVAENAARRTGVEPERFPAPVRRSYWIAAHVGFGVVLAIAYELLPRPRSGVRFGVAA